jgi:hypothetical protein
MVFKLCLATLAIPLRGKRLRNEQSRKRNPEANPYQGKPLGSNPRTVGEINDYTQNPVKASNGDITPTDNSPVTLAIQSLS